MLPSILRIARLHRTRRATALAEIGLHPGQDTVLLLILRSGALTMTEIARALAIQPPTVTKIVGRLVANELVARREVRGDMRKSAVDLTDLGRRRAGEVETIWSGIESTALAEVSAHPSFLQSLKQIEENLTSPGQLSPEAA